MSSPYVKDRATIYTEIFAFSLLIAIAIIKYFGIHDRVEFIYTILIGLGIVITIYQLTLYFFYRNVVFRFFIILFAAFFWAAVVYTVIKIVRKGVDELTWLATVLTFVGTFSAYIYLENKYGMKKPG